MPWIATTKYGTGTYGGVAGKWWYCAPVAQATVATFVEVAFPTGVAAVDQRPSYCVWTGDSKSRLYSVGGHTDNLVFTEDKRLLRQGIQPPTNPIIAGAGSGTSIGVVASGSSGRTGQCVCYVSWWDDVHKRRSPLSGASAAVTLANQGITFANLPTATDDLDPSVTHMEFWISMDGLTPRLAIRRDIGTVAASETVPELSLGEAYAEDFTFFPRCKYNVAWHDRQVMAGDERYPDRVYFSVLNEFEQYANFYLRTRKGERVVALYSVRDNLFVASEKSTYVVTGYTEDDVAMDIFEPAIGCITHHGVQLVHGIAVVPTHLGIYLNTGDSFHYISEGFGETWRAAYAAARLQYEDGFSANDTERGVYKFTPKVTGTFTTTSSWVLDYKRLFSDTTGNYGTPDLTMDTRTRKDTCAGSVMLPDGRRSDLLTGSSDGTIRFEDYASDDTDDGDVSYKRLTIKTKHYFPAPPGGTEDDGLFWPTGWVFVVHESNTVTISAWLGDEYASSGDADFTADFTATAEVVTVDDPIDPTHYYWDYTSVPKACEVIPIQQAGRGIALSIVVALPVSTFEFKGFGLTHIPGPNHRGMTAVKMSKPG